MRPLNKITMLALTLALVGGQPTAQTAQEKSSIEEIRTELLQLPYYSVFDFLAFSYNKGTVTLMGYASHNMLKPSAEHAVRRASGVDQVVDKIEQLPVSANDDDLRWKTYYAIYRDPFLSRYAPGGAMLWGHRHAGAGGFRPLGQGRFAGMEAAGDYPIHIVVKGGKITLFGVVDNDSDKSVAGIKAKEVPGSFGVDNQLEVERSST